MQEALDTRPVYLVVHRCTNAHPDGKPVRVEMRTRSPDDPVWRLMVRRGVECPQCGRGMEVVQRERRVRPDELV